MVNWKTEDSYVANTSEVFTTYIGATHSGSSCRPVAVSWSTRAGSGSAASCGRKAEYMRANFGRRKDLGEGKSAAAKYLRSINYLSYI